MCLCVQWKRKPGLRCYLFCHVTCRQAMPLINKRQDDGWVHLMEFLRVSCSHCSSVDLFFEPLFLSLSVPLPPPQFFLIFRTVGKHGWLRRLPFVPAAPSALNNCYPKSNQELWAGRLNRHHLILTLHGICVSRLPLFPFSSLPSLVKVGVEGGWLSIWE